MKPLHCISCMLLLMLLSQSAFVISGWEEGVIPWWLHCQRGRRNSKNMKKGSPLEKLEKMIEELVKCEKGELLGEFGENKIFWKMVIIVRGSIIFAFLWSNCHFWTWIAILGSSQWSKVKWTIVLSMDLKWDFWLLSGIWSFHAFFCLISRAYAILMPAWSFPLLSLAYGPSCAFMRKPRVFSYSNL